MGAVDQLLRIFSAFAVQSPVGQVTELELYFIFLTSIILPSFLQVEL